MDFMEQAISLLNKYDEREIPVAALIVKDGIVISKATNKKEQDSDVTSHAEILAIRNAERVLNNWRLDGCELYVTLEPCPMCSWAIINSRIKSVYFGSYDHLYGALGSKIDLRKISNSNLKVYGGIKQDLCDKILEEYFNKLRRN
ncbi:nucleoside deaminase [bacterium]|nr:nucleoside deaminase [bacterium]